MIYTVTFSPAIDYIVHLNGFQPGATNRSTGEEYYFGGKGINVSTVLKTLGIRSTALGFISGFTGHALESGLRSRGLETDFIELQEGITRINVKIKGNVETEINGQGPEISSAAVAELFGKIEALKAGDVLVISGTVPESLPKDIYEQIMKRTRGRGIMTVVDATGELMLNVLKYEPFLIKPNNDELADMLGAEMKTAESIIDGARKLRAGGARNVLVSRGAKGAVLVTEEDEVFESASIPGKAVNTVGAGDSMVAGFLAGYMKGRDYSQALKLGIAAGSATACSPGLAKAEDIERRMK